MTLSPTLWRTCSVLMNPVRLRCLRAVLREPGQCVSAVAKEVRVSLPVASQYLRDLQARGLLSVARRSRWVFYSGRPDPAVEHAALLLSAVSAALNDKEYTERDVCAVLDGLAHPRRIVILSHLSRSRAASPDEMRCATGISAPALWRHLKKLEACRWVQGHTDRWSLASNLPPLARRLLAEISG